MSDFDFSVGKIVGFHGLKGEVKIRPRTNNPALLLGIETVEVDYGQGPQRLLVKEIHLEKRLLFVKFKGLDDRNAVEHLLNTDVFTTRLQLSHLEDDEWWVDDLIGLPVYTTDGREVGTICSIIEGAGELLEVASTESGGGTILIPFVKALVPVVDVKGRRVEVVDLPGLLESH